MVLQAARFQMASAFKKWMSGDRHEDQYGNAQEALEVGFKAGYKADKEAGYDEGESEGMLSERRYGGGVGGAVAHVPRDSGYDKGKQDGYTDVGFVFVSRAALDAVGAVLLLAFVGAVGIVGPGAVAACARK